MSALNDLCPACKRPLPIGRLAFMHRHLALSFVRRENQELHDRAAAAAHAELDAMGHTFEDYVAKLEAERDALRARFDAIAAALAPALEAERGATAGPLIVGQRTSDGVWFVWQRDAAPGDIERHTTFCRRREDAEMHAAAANAVRATRPLLEEGE